MKMKKSTFLLMAAMLLGSVGAWGQGVATYTMETSTEPWVSIAATGTQLTSVVGDGGYQNIAMPFEFPFGEATLAQGVSLCMRADGYMLLNSGTGTHHAYGYCNTGTRVIVPFLLVDGQMPQGNSGCWWQVETADDGSQVLVVEFQHVQHYNVSTDDFNYQVRLYENGDVSVHYGHMENHASDSSFNLMMVSDIIGGYNDAIALSGSWANPTAFHPNTMGSSSLSVTRYITGMPDSGLVVTFRRPEPPCPKPRNVRAEELGPTSCQLVWRGNGVGGCTYEVYMDTTPFNVNYPGSRPLLSTNDTVLYFDSLLPNHQYSGYIRSNCGADVSNWATFSIYTPCVSISHAELPFTEDFEFYTGSQYRRTLFNPGCWRGDGYVTQQSGYGGHRCLFLSNGGDAQPIIVALPAIDSVSELELTFSVQPQSGTLEVGVLDEADNLMSFVPLQTISAPSNTWSIRSVRFNTYEGTGKAIAFRVTTAVSRIYIDDIDVHVAVGCPAVETLTVSDVASTTATVGWTDPNQVGSYRVVYRPLASAETDTVYASASPAVLTGLMPDVEYLVLVYALCGAETSTAVSATFHTLCSPMTAPFSEGFESEALSFCWTARSMRFNSGSPFPDWLPEVTPGVASEGSHSLRLASKRTNLVGREASWVVLPTMTDAPNRVMVDFDYRVPSGYEYVELAVGITTSETDTSGFVRLASIRPADSNWHRYSFDFALSGITDGRIALLQDNHSDHSYAGGLPNEYGYLDSVVVTPFAGCMRPVALGVNMVTDAEATVEWTDINGAGTYEVTCGSQTVTVTGDTSWTFTGLSPQTTYAVSVRTMCPDGFTEALSTSFTTACAGISSLPWTEDFDSWQNGSFDSCWTRLQGQDSYSSVEIFTLQNTPCIRLNSEVWQGDTARSFLVLPYVAVPYAGISISMNVTGINTSMTNAMLELGVMTDITDRTSFTAFDTVPFVNSLDNWSYYERALDGIGDGRLALRMTSFSGWKQVLVDDISLFYATSCARPDSLVLDSATLGSLSVRIVDPDSAGRYRLWWGVGERTDSADVSGYVYTITGLHHSTNYDVWVASICPSDSTLSSALAVRMATACGVIAHDELPWSENYNDGLGLCQSFIDYCYPGNSGDRTNRRIGRGYSGALVPNVGEISQPFFYVMPQVDSLVGVAVDFWARGEAEVQVGVMSDPADTLTFTALRTITLPSLEDWHEYYVSLGSSSATNIHVAMRFGNAGGRFHAPAVLDDVRLVHDLSCSAPDSVSVAAVTDSSVLLVVHDPRGVGHYRVYVLGDSIDIVGDSVDVGGLSGATDYTFELSSVCQEGLPTFRVAVSFTTECGAFELPYTEEFEGCRVNRMPRCWEVKGTPAYTPSVRNATVVVNGQQALMGSIADSDSVLTVTSPLLHVADTDAYVSFMVAARQSYIDSTHQSHYLPMRVRVVYTGDTSAVEVLLYDDSVASSQTSYSSPSYDWYTIDLATRDIPVGDGRLYFSFFRDTLASSASFYLDSLSVYTVHTDPPCRPVAALRLDSVTLGSAWAGWTPQGPATEWEVWLGSRYGDTLLQVDTPSVVFTTLEQGTDYHLVVRPMCHDGQVLWSDTLTFTTLVCPPVEEVRAVATGSHSVEVEWQAPTAGPWRLEYGPMDYEQGRGTELIVDAQAPGRVATRVEGLEANTIYDLYVMTLCDEAKKSVWSEMLRFTTGVEGIGQVVGDGHLDLVPNPASGWVELRGVEPGDKVTVRDVAGRLVMTVKMEGVVLDISALSAGVYYISTASDRTTATTKLVVF